MIRAGIKNKTLTFESVIFPYSLVLHYTFYFKPHANRSWVSETTLFQVILGEFTFHCVIEKFKESFI